TGDPAYERATRYGLTRESIEAFQRSRSPRVTWLKGMRSLTVSGARRYVSPSRSLKETASRWPLVHGERIVVLPNPVEAPALAGRDALRAKLGFSGPTLVFAGRLALQKSLDVALRALAEVEGVSLVLAGDGPELDGLQALAKELGLDDRVRFLGPQPREAVFEGLAAGTPVIATDVGGVAEVVTDGVNGLLVPMQDVPALAAAIRRFFSDA